MQTYQANSTFLTRFFLKWATANLKGLIEFKKKKKKESRPLFTINFNSKMFSFKTWDFSPLVLGVLGGVCGNLLYAEIRDCKLLKCNYLSSFAWVWATSRAGVTPSFSSLLGSSNFSRIFFANSGSALIFLTTFLPKRPSTSPQQSTTLSWSFSTRCLLRSLHWLVWDLWR